MKLFKPCDRVSVWLCSRIAKRQGKNVRESARKREREKILGMIERMRVEERV